MASVTENLEKFLLKNELLDKKFPRNFKDIFTHLQCYEEDNKLHSLKIFGKLKKKPTGITAFLILHWGAVYRICELSVNEKGYWDFNEIVTHASYQFYIAEEKLRVFKLLETYPHRELKL